ncbi:MAG TPA: hypothetical protein VEX38_07180, partial [Fimbriimonadaceae bacterium]|nr:hypothetical protein [Fimbriimonadaceae bacterium]
LEPFGEANPEPLFCARGITFARIIPTKNPSHPRVTLRAGTGPLIQGMAFSQGERLMEFEPGFTADILFQPKINEWQGARSMKWEVKSFVPVD